MITLALTPNSIEKYAEAVRPGWQVWSERGRGNIKVQAFSSKKAACKAFEGEVVSRILVDPLDREDRSSLGLNMWALSRVRNEHAAWYSKRLQHVSVETTAGTSSTFSVPSRARIGDVKAKVEHDWGVPAVAQTILHDGVAVKDSELLSSVSRAEICVLRLALAEERTDLNIENIDVGDANVGTADREVQLGDAPCVADDDGRSPSCLHISTVGGLPVFTQGGRMTDASLWPPQLDIDSVVAAMSASGASPTEPDQSLNLSPLSNRAPGATFDGLTLSLSGSPVQTPAGSRAPSTDSVRSDASMQEAQKLVATMFSPRNSRPRPKRGRSVRHRQSTPSLASALISPQCLDTPPQRCSRDSAPAAFVSYSAPVGRYKPPTPVRKLQPLNGSMPHFPPAAARAPSERSTGGAQSRQASTDRHGETALQK